jgi:tripartite-type tricarboxylate transporter receptor subunit TctC
MEVMDVKKGNMKTPEGEVVRLTVTCKWIRKEKRRGIMERRKSQLLAVFGMLFVVALLCALPAGVSAADTFPSKPVHIIVPWPAGGANDIVARLLSVKLTERLGKQVIVENRPGAGGIIGTEAVAKADPDGYTLLITATAHTFQPVIQKVPFDPIKDFTPIARVVTAPYVLAIGADVPANSVKEFIALAKQKPGQLVFASVGIGTTPHMGSELFKVMADVDVKIIQFKGGTPAMIDVIGGHSHAVIGSVGQMMPHIKAGKLKLIGNFGAKRSPILPDVPTLAEAGIPGIDVFDLSQSWGIVGPARMPAPIVDRLTKEIAAALTSEDLRKQLLPDGNVPDYLGPADFGRLLVEEGTRWAAILKKTNIKLE